MNKKEKITLTACAVIFLGLFGLFLWGQGKSTALPPGAVNPGAESILSIPETFYDFGTISMADGNVVKEFSVTNTGSEDVILAKITTSCMCTTAYLKNGEKRKGPFGFPGHGGPVPPANEYLRPGETKIIEVVYDPAAHGPAGVGPIDRFVYVEDASGGTTALEIKAVVTP